MTDDVRESFLQLAEAHSAAEVLAACEADSRLLDPAFEAYLIGFEEELRAGGQDTEEVSAWRLVLRSVREGRNLYATVDDLFAAGSARQIRDLALAEPLLLDPVVDAMLRRRVREARQQGHDRLAEAIEAQRQLLARLRAHGPVDGYFDVLVTELAYADPAGQLRLQRENADLAEDFQHYARERRRSAATLGHHDRMQQLMLATALMAGNTIKPERSFDAELSDRIGRLAGIVLRDADPEAWRDVLLAAPELLAGSPPVIVAAMLGEEIDRAALDRDLVRVRALWVSRNLLLRASEIGAAEAFDELEAGKLWPRPTDRI